MTKTNQPVQPEIEILRRAMLFRLTRHAWQNRAKADNKDIEADAEKSELNVTKRLVQCKELQDIYQFQNEVYNWCLARSMMNSVARGTYFVKRDMVGQFEIYLAAANETLADELVPKLVAAFPEAKEKAKVALNGLFRESDYPEPEELRGAFSFEHSWLALSVPDELPEEVRRRECDKLRESFADAQEEVKFALREGFKGIVDNAARLLTEKGESGRQRIFGAKTVESFDKFFDTFHARNLMDDAELAALVEMARGTVAGLDLKKVKNNPTMRSVVADQFQKINEDMEKLVAERPSRRFKLKEVA